MGLADLLGMADLLCRKVESTKWLKHKLRATREGLEFVMQAFGDSRKLSSSGLAFL